MSPRCARAAIALIFLALAGCYKPAFEDCALTCGPGALCPDELTCESGYCRTRANAGACPSGDPDGSVDTPDAPPGTPDSGPADAAMLPDSASMCTSCDPITQSCCLPAEACDISTAGASYCRGISTGSTQGIPCTVGDQCAKGYTCAAPDGTFTAGATTCREFCNGDGDCQAPGGWCDVKVEGGVNHACTTTCDPIAQTGCQVDFACTPAMAANGTHWHTDCRPVGQFAQGHICTVDNECRKNLICAGGKCAKLCRMAAPGNSACNGGATCTRLGTGAVIGGIEYGACM